MSANPIIILMVEDNPGDIELTKEAMSSGKLNNELHVVEDGEAALDFLFQRGEYTNSPRPDLVLLDLNLPKVSGQEVLAEIKASEELADLPVVILSSSTDHKDIASSYHLKANSYVSKPVRMDEFLEVTKAIEHFWVEIVRLPSGKN